MISDEIFAELEGDKETLARMKQSRVETQQNRQAIQKEIAALGKKIHELKKVEEDLGAVLWQKRSGISRVEKQIEAKERELLRQRKEAEILDRIGRQGEVLDLLTSDAKWRKDARSYQLAGAKQLALAGRGILGDKRGLGKTLTSLIWLDMLNARRVIIFVPKETASVFRKQMPRWAPTRPIFDLTSKSRAERNAVLSILPQLERFNILINLEAWRNDPTLLDKLVAVQAEAVIIDEAHSIKDDQSLAFKGVKKIVYPEESEATVKWVLTMTGTPFLNYPDEMWTLLYLVDKESWPTKKAYREDYLSQTWEGKWKFADQYLSLPSGRERLVERLGLRFVARDRNDAGVEIPPQEIVVHELEFNAELYPKQFKAYGLLEANAALLMQGMTEQQVVGVEGLAILTRLRQMITWPQGIRLTNPETEEVMFSCNIPESVKIDAAEKMVKQLVKEGERIVLFSQFKAPLHELHSRLDRDGVSVVVLDGTTKDEVREEIKRDFDADRNSHQWDVVLCNYKVAGQSLDFTAASQMIILDEEWNPGRNEQAYGRIDRIGQTKKTTVHILRTPDTVDMDMANLVATKQDEIGAFEASVKAATKYLLSKAA